MITAFTHPCEGIVNRICIDCIISLPNDESSETEELKALWDTGAMATCISDARAKQMGLVQVDTTQVLGANNVPFDAPVYVVRVRMGDFIIPANKVIGLPMKDAGHEMIIGMDIISRGDLTITNSQGRTVLTFREPSLETIDYVKEISLQDRCYKIHLQNIQRKIPDKCACGSGRDFKNCHGNTPYMRHEIK